MIEFFETINTKNSLQIALSQLFLNLNFTEEISEK